MLFAKSLQIRGGFQVPDLDLDELLISMPNRLSSVLNLALAPVWRPQIDENLTAYSIAASAFRIATPSCSSRYLATFSLTAANSSWRLLTLASS